MPLRFYSGTSGKSEKRLYLLHFFYSSQMNETFSPPDDKCAEYTCQDVSGDPMLKENRKMCPEFDPENCVPVRD